ncbi:lysozyme inhibitor LprI family protein [Caulobacter hibisci]|uniref:DUF1311 domain-containing protein n=1 Tax=Caulobacter hibisci TaxID=2035993 RepID=A0ABS0SX26_9CAUL|nr:lysozyme inhibitor LprI family protein [Caulobacter hibisci]MBI1683954.1 DUF1311 domain-containing protein [Caulobacter hibisci]
MYRTSKAVLLAVLWAGLCGFAGQNGYFGEPDGRNPGDPQFAKSQALCRAVRDRAPPPRDVPDAATAQALKGCSSEALYYGIGMAADPAKARQCAILEMKNGEDPYEPFAGAGMLMTIYANGRGAKKDLDLAVHMACATWGAPVDSDNLVLALDARRRDGPATEPFDYCADVVLGASNVSGPFCLAHEARQAEPVRAAKLAALTRGFSPTARQAYEALNTAEARFVEVRQANESPPGAMNRGVPLRISEDARDFHVEQLEQLSGSARVTGAGEHRDYDRSLNAVYRVAMGELPARQEAQAGDITRDGVRETERAWIAYRDAWLAFAPIAWPKASTEALAARLTRDRVGQLACILADHDIDPNYAERCSGY